MALKSIKLIPGVNKQFTATLNETMWADSNLIRFKDGLPQSRGGWTKVSPTAVAGKVRGMHAWDDLSSNSYLAAGSEQQLVIIWGGVLYDITPIRTTHDVAPTLSTVNGSNVVTVKDVAFGSSAGDAVDFFIPVSVGGLIIFGRYVIQTTPDNDHYTIIASANATSTVTDGGAVPSFTTVNTSSTVTVDLDDHGFMLGSIFTVQVPTMVGGLTLQNNYTVLSTTTNSFTIQAGGTASSSATAFENSGNARIIYYIPSGHADATLLTGYGSSGYGIGPYGTTSNTSSYEPPREWSIDNWGEDMVACYINGPIYEWTPPVSLGNNAEIISGAPIINHSIFVAMPQRQIVALASESGGNHDPNLVRWCDVDDFNDWTASTTNQAGSYRIPTGSGIVGGFQCNLQGLIWTNVDMWVMQYIGYPLVYGFTKVGTGCGLIATRAAAILGQIVVWMSQEGFFIYYPGAGVQALPCSVWDYVFEDLNTIQVEKITAAANSLFNEIEFYFPSISGGTGENDKYAKVNLLNPANPIWDVGTLSRLAWIDESVLGPPIGSDPNGFLMQHETSNYADGAFLDAWAETGYAEISNGDYRTFTDMIIPDFKLDGPDPEIDFTLKFTNYPNDTPKVKGPYTVDSSTRYLRPRARARQLALRMGAASAGTFWKLGNVRYAGAPDGRR